jgi:methyl-accepting chemotaxis protein
MNEDNKLKVVFAPGALDNFEGTQEELDEMVAEIQRLAESGELEERAIPVDFEDEDPELQDAIEDMIKSLIQSENRTLH